MLHNLWRKILRDVWLNRKRTALVVLSIAVGVFSVGVVAQMRVIISQDLASTYASINPASAMIQTTTSIPEDLIETIRRMPEVAEAEGVRTIQALFKTAAGRTSRAIEVIAFRDYEDIRINKVSPELVFNPDPISWPKPNVWPPPKKELLIERTSLLVAYLGLTRLDQGDSILLKMPNGQERSMPLAGLTYDFSKLPAPSAGRAYGYVSFDTLEWLNEPREFNTINLVVAGDRSDVKHIKRMVELVRRKLEKNSITILKTEIPVPGKLPLDSQFQAITLVLGVLGILSLCLSAILVVNTISAIIIQDVRQIGVMKAIGARQNTIVTLYLTMVLVFSSLSLAIAVPLATLAARALINFMAYFINFNLSEWSISRQVIAIEVVAGLYIPLLAALFPIFRGTRITVREAIAFTSGDAEKERGKFDRVVWALGQGQSVPRPMMLSLRNTFRRTGRLILTLTTFGLACAIFTAVISIRASLLQTVENALNLWQFDIQITFSQPHRVTKLENEVQSIPGIVAIESWRESNGFRLRPDDSEGNNINIRALSALSQMIEPNILAGHWLSFDVPAALVVNLVFIEEEPDVEIGDMVTLKIEGHETDWQLVGIVETVASPQAMAFVNFEHFVRAIRDVDKATSLQLVTAQHSSAYLTALAEQLRTHFEAKGLSVNTTQTSATLREASLAYINIIVAFLLAMAILLVAVGSLGLMGTVSLNVLERTKEIGIMRAIGASNGSLYGIVIVEGLLIGLLSWILGTLLAFPLGKIMSQEVGIRFIQQPLAYVFAPEGVLISLAIILILSALATWMPAQSAVQISIRDTLVYE